MASNATVTSAQASSVGPWCEVVTSSSITLGATASTNTSFPLASTGSGSKFALNPLLPVTACVLAITNSAYPIQSNTNTGLPANCGIQSIQFDSTTAPANLNVVWNNTGAAATIANGQRIVFLQVQGI